MILTPPISTAEINEKLLLPMRWFKFWLYKHPDKTLREIEVDEIVEAVLARSAPADELAWHLIESGRRELLWSFNPDSRTWSAQTPYMRYGEIAAHRR